MRLLFSNIGRRTYFIDFVMKLKQRGYPIDLYLSDVVEESASFWVADGIPHFLTPRVLSNKDSYAEKVLRECVERKIEAVVPFIDFELELLAAAKDRFAEKGIRIVVSDYDLVRACMDKKVNYEYCLSRGIPVPRTFFSDQGLPDLDVFVKKQVAGCSSADLKILTRDKLRKELQEPIFADGFMLQEFIKGEEYGMNILNDLDGNFVHATFCKKILMRAGETDKGRVFYSDQFQQWAKTLSRTLRHVGNMDIDFIVDAKGDFYFIDFNPRFGGLYPAAYLAGYDYLEYIICMLQGKPFTIPAGRTDFVFMKGISLYSYDERT